MVLSDCRDLLGLKKKKKRKEWPHGEMLTMGAIVLAPQVPEFTNYPLMRLVCPSLFPTLGGKAYKTIGVQVDLAVLQLSTTALKAPRALNWGWAFLFWGRLHTVPHCVCRSHCVCWKHCMFLLTVHSFINSK